MIFQFSALCQETNKMSLQCHEIGRHCLGYLKVLSIFLSCRSNIDLQTCQRRNVLNIIFLQAKGNSFMNWEPVRQPFIVDSDAAVAELANTPFQSCPSQLSSLALNVT